MGTTFTVELPIATDSSRPDSYDSFDDLAENDLGNASFNVRNIVYIEHNNEHVELIKTVVEALGIGFCTARNGRQGVELVQKILPELVILNILLPDMTGSEVMTILRANLETANIPIVIVSGGASENKIRRMLALGAVAYLPKPLDLDRLRYIVEANSNTVRL
ncbi:MAG: response regulator [Acidimicrobiales bacterium]|nr:response regulator [Acidimicrobiales bacterium]